ncbi:MAG: hypothetical protein ACOX05_04790 [Bacillota bacterium]
MRITKELFLSAGCPFCQEILLLRSISPFMLHRRQKKEISCTCGSLRFFIHTGEKNLYVDYFCPICLDNHSYIFSLSELKNQQLVVIHCQETGLNLASLGERKKVVELLKKDGQIILYYQDTLQDLLSHSAQMSEILQHFLQLLAQDQVLCSCKSHDFDLRLCGSRLLLLCSHCGASVSLSTKSPHELQHFKQSTYILLDKISSDFTFKDEDQLLNNLCSKNEFK